MNTRAAIDRLFEDTRLRQVIANDKLGLTPNGKRQPGVWPNGQGAYRRTGRSQWKTGWHPGVTKFDEPGETEHDQTSGAFGDSENDVTPDTIYGSGERFVTFILSMDGRKGIASYGGDAHFQVRRDYLNGEDEDLVQLDPENPLDPGHPQGADRSSFIEGRAANYETGDYQYTIAFWNGLDDVIDRLNTAIQFCHSVNDRYPTEASQWYLSTSDWAGSAELALQRAFPAEYPVEKPPAPVDPDDAQGQGKLNLDEPEVAAEPAFEPDNARRDRFEIARQLHVVSPDVKAALGIKPDYRKKGPGIKTRQMAMASESQFPGVVEK